MPDVSEAELDAAAAAARDTVARTEALAAAAAAARREREEWEAANGISDQARERFFAGLPEAEKRRAEEERERFAAEVERDLGELERAHRPPSAGPAGARKRPRSFA